MKKIVRTYVIDEELYKSITLLADYKNRSVNSLVINLLKKALKEHDIKYVEVPILLTTK